MAEKMFKVNEVIEIVYQAPNKETGLGGGGIIAEIFLPSDSKDSNFPDLELTEIESSGVYKEEFIPDVQGEWKVVIHKSDGDGQVVKRYSVGLHNVSSVGEGVSAVDTKANNIVTAIDALPTTSEVDGVVDAALADYDAPTKAELDAAHDVTDGKIDALDTKVSSLDTPPMVS